MRHDGGIAFFRVGPHHGAVALVDDTHERALVAVRARLQKAAAGNQDPRQEQKQSKSPVDLVFFWGGDFNIHDRLQDGGVGFGKRYIEKVTFGTLVKKTLTDGSNRSHTERKIVGIDNVRRACEISEKADTLHDKREVEKDKQRHVQRS